MFQKKQSPKENFLSVDDYTSELFKINEKLRIEIAERKQVEQRLAAQYAVACILSDSISLAQATPAILQAICENLGWIIGELWYLDRSSNLLRYVAGWYNEQINAEELETATRQYAFPIGVGLPGYIWEKKKPVWVTDISKKKHFSRSTTAAEQELRAAVGFPILINNQVIGVILFFSSQIRPLDRNLLHMMTTIGSHLGQFIERKDAEEKQIILQTSIQKSALEWQETFDIIDSLILILDINGEIRKLNWAARQLCGKSYKKAIGSYVGDISKEQPWKKIDEFIKNIPDNHHLISDLVQDNLTGKSWSISAFLLLESELADKRIIVVARDITKIIELEEALRRSETMATMGTLIAGVAHEVRNPLFSITATLDAFEKEFLNKDEYKDYLRILRNNLNRLTNLMKELLEYSKPSTYELRQNSFVEILQQAVQSCYILSEELQVKIENNVVLKDFPMIFVDKMRLIQVFQNILENAIQHSPKGKVVSLDANLVSINNRQWLECCIKDEGTGFLVEDMNKVFEPFFTRRRAGIGLGLSIVQRIVEKHRGKVIARNHPTGGAIVTVLLPVFFASETIS